MVYISPWKCEWHVVLLFHQKLDRSPEGFCLPRGPCVADGGVTDTGEGVDEEVVRDPQERHQRFD